MTSEERRRDRTMRKASIAKQMARWNAARQRATKAASISHAETRQLQRVLEETAHREAHREQAIMTNSLRVQNYRALDYGHTAPEEMLTEAQWRGLLDRFGHCCAYCGHKSSQLTIDHILSQSQGGKHTLANIVPSCLSCNSAKQARTPTEWITYLYTVRLGRMKGENVEWIIRLCTDNEEFRQSLQAMMGVGDGTPEQVARAFVEWVQERAPRSRA
jgi:5-methylcytosine-specific restriction endonuclease McrA